MADTSVICNTDIANTVSIYPGAIIDMSFMTDNCSIFLNIMAENIYLAATADIIINSNIIWYFSILMP